MDATSVATRKKAGTAGGAYGALAIGMVKSHATLYQAVNVRRANMFIAQAANGVPALLVGADPEYVGLQRGTPSIILLRLIINVGGLISPSGVRDRVAHPA